MYGKNSYKLGLYKYVLYLNMCLMPLEDKASYNWNNLKSNNNLEKVY